MPKLRTTKNNFTAGEIAPDLLGRPDLAAYANGAARLRNVLIRPTGGVSRRPGLRHVAQFPGIEPQAVRLIGFSFNVEQTYLLLLSDNQVRVFRNDIQVASLATPWSAAQLSQLSWVQSADTLFLCHPEVPPQRLTRTSHHDWQLTAFAFKAETETGVIQIPSFKFAADSVTLQPSGTGGSITLTSSAACFSDTHVGTRFRIKRKQVLITAVASDTSATATVKQALVDTAATEDWEEQAFSALRGWPVAVTLFQERLIFAGSRDLPNRIWMSKTSDITNFDLGTALDDEAIEFSLLADQVDAIRAVVAGRHLQLFTAGAEWMVAGEPMTPTKVRAERQTRIGSLLERNIPPRVVDGATLFLARDGGGLQQFLYADTDQAYSADDLALVAAHLFDIPLDMDYDATRRLILIPMADGGIAAQTSFRAQQILAWTRLETDGAFHAVAVVNGAIYALVDRGGLASLERFDDDCHTDASQIVSSDTPQTTWSGLSHLEGRTVRIRADGLDCGNHLVSDGSLTLPDAAYNVEIGLAFNHEIEPLPADLGGDAGNQAGPLRLIRAIFRLQDTAALVVDCGQGLKPQSFIRFGLNCLDTSPALFTGDRELRGLGWVRGLERPLWRIEQNIPQPFTLLAVITDLKGAD